MKLKVQACGKNKKKMQQCPKSQRISVVGMESDAAF